jgi:drug/metabolite transporter (DMT)-like permease
MGDGDTRRLGTGLVLGSAAISGVSIYVNSLAVVNLPPAVFTGLKNLIVAMALLVPLLVTREARDLARIPRGDWLRLMAIGVVGGSVPFILFFHGLALTSGAMAGFIHKAMFLAVALLAFTFLRERLDLPLAVMAVLLLGGTAVFLFGWPPRIDLASGGLGLLLVLAATLLWATEITLSRATLRRLGSSTVAFGRMGFGAAFIAVYLGATQQWGTVGALTTLQWQWVLVTVLFLFAYVMTFYAGLKRIDATSATGLLVVGAPITLGVTLLAEGGVVAGPQVAGIALILLGAAAGVARALRHPSPAAQEAVPSGA